MDSELYSYDCIENENNSSIDTTYRGLYESRNGASHSSHGEIRFLVAAYPNPGGDVMNIRTSLRNCTLQVYDMQGRMVHQQEITDDVTSVDASNWPSGTYVWKLEIMNEELGMKEVESGKWVK